MVCPGTSIRQPRESADFAEPALERSPTLSAICAAIDLAEGRGSINQLWVCSVDGQEIRRAFDLARQARIFPVGAVIAAAKQAASGARRTVAVGHEHDPATVRSLKNGARVLPLRVNRAHRPVCAIIMTDMQSLIRGGEKNALAVAHHAKAMNIL